MTTDTRPLTIAPAFTPCGFENCATDRNAIHVLTRSFPRLPAGIAVCGFHSPFDVTDADRLAQTEINPPQRRWDVVLSHVSPEFRDVHTFTWAATRNGAIARVADLLDSDGIVWDGWNFTVATLPTEILSN